jgi:uncharacterized repeat protein (TIGR03803 family)
MVFALRSKLSLSISRISSAVVLIGILAATVPAVAQTETVFYNFCALASCADGRGPSGGVSMDSSGNLYGVTWTGGAYAEGTLFEYSADGTYTVLHSFGEYVADGNTPFYAVPLVGAHGDLYGTTSGGGAHGGGTVYRLTLSGEEKILYSFCATGGTACTDGSNPYAGLIADRQQNLYGTTQLGGAHDYGTVFKLSPNGTETVLYSFTGGSDGGEPLASLVMDAKGNLYGTTQYGGNPVCNGSGCGVVFKITPSGKESVLYAFCQASKCTDGYNPASALIFDKKGNLYGTTYNGGAYYDGTVFRINANGQYKIVHSFKGSAGDGMYPFAPVVMDSAGNLYGTTGNGGSSSQGAMYEISSTGKETILHNFTNATDGSNPQGNLAMDASGNLYAITLYGGEYDDGTIFKVTP